MSDDSWHDAVSALYREESSRLIDLARWIVGDQGFAEELVHDTFARLLERPVSLDDQTKLAAYARAAVVNRSRSRVRRLVLERRHSKREAARIGRPLTEHDAQSGGRLDTDVRDAIAALPRRQREVVVLRFHSDLDIAGIAALLGISDGSVKTHLHRANKTLSQQLATRRPAPANPPPQKDAPA